MTWVAWGEEYSANRRDSQINFGGKGMGDSWCAGEVD